MTCCFSHGANKKKATLNDMNPVKFKMNAGIIGIIARYASMLIAAMPSTELSLAKDDIQAPFF